MVRTPMTKVDIVKAIAKKCDISGVKAQLALDSLSALIKSQVEEGNDVRISGLGTFQSRKSEPRTGRNPATGESIEIPAKKRMVFKQSKTVKELLNPSDNGEAE